MPAVWLDILIILVLILLNGFFALAELSVISASTSRLRTLAEDGSRAAARALALAENPSALLSSVQVGITTVGVLAGAFGGATLAAPLAAPLNSLPLIAPYGETVAFIIVVFLVTYLTVVIGELVPKRLALKDPEALAMRVAAPISAFTWLFSPLVALLSASSEGVLRVLRLPPPARPPVTDEEIRLLFAEGVTAGVFQPQEEEIIDRLFRLSDRRVSALMTPRPDIVWLEADAAPAAIAALLAEHAFSAYPVARDGLDTVLGIVYTRELAAGALREDPLDLPALVHPPLMLHESASALTAIERVKADDAHLALIIDEYGEVVGLLTLTDIVASLLGEVPEPGGEAAVVQRPDGSWLVDGFLPIDELKELLDVRELPEEEHGAYHTLAGFIMAYTGRVPSVGDRFTWHHYTFEIVDMDATRLDRVLITPQADTKG